MIKYYTWDDVTLYIPSPSKTGNVDMWLKLENTYGKEQVLEVPDNIARLIYKNYFSWMKFKKGRLIFGLVVGQYKFKHLAVTDNEKQWHAIGHKIQKQRSKTIKVSDRQKPIVKFSEYYAWEIEQGIF